VADYSEFPTTPTGWQERQLADWQTVTPMETEDPEHPRTGPDLVALIPGVLFIVLAVVFMTGIDLPENLFRGGGILWVALIGAGIALLVSELRKARRRR
jgi:Na+/H+ antiporter NhaD/arsenite permease-like protein